MKEAAQPAAEVTLLEALRAAPVFQSRNEHLQHAARYAQAGVAAEFGVYTGGSLTAIVDVRKGLAYGFDSFEGLPLAWDTGAGEPHQAGHFATELPTDLPNRAHLVPGWFKDTIPAWLADHEESIALLHIDCDLYESAAEVLHGMNERILPGTVIVFDELVDFAEAWYPNWRDGEWKALCEWIEKHGRTVRPLARTEHQQASLVVVE